MLTSPPFRPKKSYGQHFLVNRQAIGTITGALMASPAERLLEIGHGAGVRTEPILADGRPLWAVELHTTRPTQGPTGVHACFPRVPANAPVPMC